MLAIAVTNLLVRINSIRLAIISCTLISDIAEPYFFLRGGRGGGVAAEIARNNQRNDLVTYADGGMTA